MRYVFGECECDTQRYELRQAGVLQPLEPQGFKVLVYLLEHRERVVSKSELLEHLWPNQYVSESTLTQRLVAVRRALADDGRTQRYIRTVHGRGYRFVADVLERTEPVSTPLTAPLIPQTLPPGSGQRTGLFVGREAELALLQERWTLALQGQRQLVVLSGEAGIGKTTLVDAFVAQVRGTTTMWIGRGQCVEQYGAGEAYLPLLEALGRLGRAPDGAPLVAALRQQAPSWLPHLPGLLSAADAAALPRQTHGLTRERMVRELAEALESITATQPLLLVLEDVHWSDVSTVDWLSYVARRRDPARLLILGTYRRSDALTQAHPFPLAVQELQRQGQALNLPLPYWDVAEVTAYLVQRFGALPFAREVVHLVHQRTRGNPFFLVAVVEAMASQGSLEEVGLDGQAWLGDIPESIRHLIAYQLESLSDEDQACLEAASVAGESFATAEIAAAMRDTVDAVEIRCDTLARKGQFIYALGLDTWPDATVATRYGFRHALYHEVLYARLAPGPRLRFHQHIGLHKERAYGARAHEIAAELALHFVRGQEPQRGVQYLCAAGQNAFQRCAYQEALRHLEPAFALLPQLPEGPVRTQHTLALHLLKGRTLMLTQGYAAPEVEHAYTQAAHLGQQLGDTPQLLPVLYGLWTFYYMRAEHQTAHELAERCLRIARQTNQGTLLGGARYVLGASLFSLGHLESARELLAQELAWYDEERQRRGAGLQVVHDAQMVCLSLAVPTWWFLGYAEQAQRYCDQILTLARQLGTPFDQALALYCAANLAHLEGHSAVAQQQAEALIALATEQSFPFWAASGIMLRGWAVVTQHRQDEGLTLLQQGLAAYRATGAVMVLPHYLGMLAEAYGLLQHVEQGLEVVREAFAIVARTGEDFYAAALHRLQGELLLMQSTSTDNVAAAAQCFTQALAVARRQQARALELRAAVSLGRLWHRQGQDAAARHLVGEITGWFTEGCETVALQEARALLTAMDSSGSPEG